MDCPTAKADSWRAFVLKPPQCLRSAYKRSPSTRKPGVTHEDARLPCLWRDRRGHTLGFEVDAHRSPVYAITGGRICNAAEIFFARAKAGREPGFRVCQTSIADFGEIQASLDVSFDFQAA